MRIFRFLFLAFLLVPILEIYVLIQVGGLIGALPTVFLVVFTALLGAVLLRYQGLSTLLRIRDRLGRGQLPAVPVLEGVLLAVAGALLLTPGFVTDAAGFALMVPALRRTMARWLLYRVLSVGMGRVRPGPGRRQDARTLEGEYRREDD